MEIGNVEGIKEKIPTVVGRAVEGAIKKVDERLNDPTKKAAGEVAGAGFWGKIKEVTWPHTKEIFKREWTNAKALAAGFIAIIPLLGEGEADASLVDAAVVEGANLADATALARGSVVSSVNEGGVVVDSLAKATGKSAWEGVKKAMKVVDPFPDVPVGVTTAAAAAEAAGLHGALVAPALWELGVGAYELLKEEIRMNKDVLAVVKEEINNRKKRAGSPEMAESAAAFA